MLQKQRLSCHVTKETHRLRAPSVKPCLIVMALLRVELAAAMDRNHRMMRKNAEGDSGLQHLEVTANGSLAQQPVVMAPAMSGMSGTNMMSGSNMGQVPFVSNAAPTLAPTTTTTVATTTAAATTAAATTAAATTAASTTEATTTEDKKEEKASNATGNSTDKMIVSAEAPPAQEDAIEKKEADRDARSLMWMVGSFLCLMIFVGCGVLFLRWRDDDKRPGAREDDRRKSADSQVNRFATSSRGYKKNTRSSKLEPPGEPQAQAPAADPKSGSGGDGEASMQRRSSYRERRSKSAERNSPSEGEAKTLKAASPGRRASSRPQSTPESPPVTEAPASPDAEPKASSYRARREASRSREKGGSGAKAPEAKAEELDF